MRHYGNSMWQRKLQRLCYSVSGTVQKCGSRWQCAW